MTLGVCEDTNTGALVFVGTQTPAHRDASV